MELKKIAKRNERREKRVSNDKKRPKVGLNTVFIIAKGVLKWLKTTIRIGPISITCLISEVPHFYNPKNLKMSGKTEPDEN